MMKKTMMLWALVTACSLFLIASPALSKDKGKGSPPGWDKGEKKGWSGDIPPGKQKAQDVGQEMRDKSKAGKRSEEVQSMEKARKEKDKKVKEEARVEARKEKQAKKTKEEIEEGKQKEKKAGFWDRWFGKGKKEKGE